MNKIWTKLQHLFFFLTGVATGVTGIVGAIYLYTLKEDAERGRRTRPAYRRTAEDLETPA